MLGKRPRCAGCSGSCCRAARRPGRCWGRIISRSVRPSSIWSSFVRSSSRRTRSSRMPAGWRCRGRREAVVRVRRPRRAVPPVLTPGQIELICSACAIWDAEARQWRGTVRDRLLWSVLAETGMRLGEALGLQHRDWHTGRGDTPFIEVVPRDDPHWARVKGGFSRRVYVSDELDRLYGEYLWQLCAQGADLAVADLDAA